MIHPLVTLRHELGLRQKELAELAGCAVSAIKRIEGGSLRLSEALAARIAVRTGAGFRWLLSDDPAGPFQDTFGSAIPAEDLDRLRHELRKPPCRAGETSVIQSEYLDACYRLAKVLVASAETGAHYLCLHRMDGLLREMESRYAVNRSALARRVRPGRVDSTAKGHTATTFEPETIWRSFNEALKALRSVVPHTIEKSRRRARTRASAKAP